jgi:flagellar basal-body rod protein FlgC
MLKSLDISSSALSANRKRLEAISSNIANAQTTRTPEGGPYRPKEVVFGSEPSRQKFSEVLQQEMGDALNEVHATEVISTNKPPIPKYEPHHPDADENGMVFYPNVNVMEEMANMISTSRSYEANINALNTAKQMAMKALEIGKN